VSGDIPENRASIGVSKKMESTMTCNPRAAGFNYGIGWGSAPKPNIYQQGFMLARRLGDQAMEASRIAWSIEMSLRAVRIAETEQERKDAVAALTEKVRKYDLAVAAE
jgi:hypothetical protein